MDKVFLEILLFFYHNLAFSNLGLTIIEIAVLSRLVFYPFIKQQVHYSKKMGELQPHISALKAKHKDNKQAFSQAQMALFKEHGINPAAGCLPAVVQIVVLFGLLGAMNQVLKMNLNTEFFFWNMAKADVHTIPGLPFPIPGVLVFLAAITQFIQTRMIMPSAPKIRKEDKPGEKEEKTDFMSDFANAQSSMIWMFPLIFLFFGTQWPSGLALYWSISSLMAIAQQYRISGLGGLALDVLKLRKLLGK